MSKLNVDQKTIKDLFQSKKSDFLIPDYQRPYAWGEAECRTLWDDIFSFAIPDEGKTEFDSNSEYSDYRFADKKKYYEGFTNSKGQVKEGTGVVELLDLTATSTDFTENDIIDRYKKMIDCFINYLQKNGLLK